VVPFVGRSGTHRRPLYIECCGDGVFLQPEGIRLSPSDFEGPPGPGNPLACALRAAREHVVALQGGTNDPAAQPYPLLLVRPSGVMAYYAAREAIQSWGSDFGYQLVDEDWTLTFPPADPTLAQVERRAIEESRQRLAWLAEVRPARPAKQVKQYRAAPTRGGVVAEGGPSVLGDQSRFDWVNSQSARGSGAGGSGSGPGGSDGSGNGNDGAGGGSGGDAILAGNGSGGAGSGGPGSGRYGGRGPGGGPGGMGQEPGGDMAGGMAGGDGRYNGTSRFGQAAAGAVAGGNGAAGGAAGGTAGNGSGTGAGSGSGSGDEGGADGRGAGGAGGVAGGAAGGLAAAGSSRGGATGGASGGSSSGGAGGGSEGASGGQSGSGGGGGGSGPAMPGLAQGSGGGAAGHAGDSSASASFSQSRGKNWASLATQDRPIPLTRPIRLECSLHEFRLLDDSGRRVENRIRIPTETAGAVDPLVQALHTRVHAWGLAGDRMYWKPQLVLSETSDGRSRREDLERLLAESGIETRSSDGRDEIRPLPPVTRATAVTTTR
jgi:hypothetical protein